MNAMSGFGQAAAYARITQRFLEAGDLTLDLAHCDGRVEDRWLGLLPREFAIIWRLAEHPGEAVAEAALMAELWRAGFDCQTAEIGALAANGAAKLAASGLVGLLAPHPGGGFVLDPRPRSARLSAPSLRGH